MESAVRGLAENQARLGHEVHVLTRLQFNRRPRTECISNVYVHRIPSATFRCADLTIPLAIPSELFKNTDVVHVHSQNSLFSLMVLRRASVLNVRTVCCFMAVDSFGDYPNPFLRPIATLYGKRNTVEAISNSNLVLVKNMRDAMTLHTRYNAEAQFLPDGLPSSCLVDDASGTRDFRRMFRIRQERYFLFVGRLHRLKGPQIIVRALKILGGDVAAVFVGPDNGYLHKVLEEAKANDVTDRVYVLGYINEEEKRSALDSAEALIVPSLAEHAEAFSIVVSEAWARRIPVVASKIGNLPYRVQDGVNGLLVNPGDARSLADAMTLILTDHKLAKSMGREGRKQCRSWLEIAQISINLYNQTNRIPRRSHVD